MAKALAFLSLVSLSLVGCTSSSTHAMIGDPNLPQMPPVGYKIVGPVNGEGSAMTICPGIQGLFGKKDTRQVAEEDAVGNAIFDRNDIDLVIAPKTKVDFLNVLGLFDRAKVTLKGQGCKLENK